MKNHLDAALQAIHAAAEVANDGTGQLDPLTIELLSAFDSVCRARRIFFAHEEARTRRAALATPPALLLRNVQVGTAAAPEPTATETQSTPTRGAA